MERKEKPAEKLPPHSTEAEQGCLGCMLLESECIDKFVKKCGTDAVWFDLRHEAIFFAMLHLRDQRKPVDAVTVYEELKVRGKLEEVGGMVYLATLPDAVPSVVNFEAYLDIVWEKYLARKWVQLGSSTARDVFERGGLNEAAIARVRREVEEWQALLQRGGGMAPVDLKRPGEFEEGYFKLVFRDPKVQAGWSLPFPFVWRIRTHEMTVMTGDSGSGKSSFLGHVAVELMKQGVRVCVASMEMPADVTLWVMGRQVEGASSPHKLKNDQTIKRAAEVLAWLNARMWVYDFVGITDWRTLLDVFEYARTEQAVDVFILDSVMRIGIPEDDLATQAIAAARFSNFCTKSGAHLISVNHVNKGDGNVKKRVSGSKKWTDNCNNLVSLERNETKARKLAELEAELQAGNIKEADYERSVAEERRKWDTHLGLHKQRWPGAPQNGSVYLFFDHASLQFRKRFEDPVITYL